MKPCPMSPSEFREAEELLEELSVFYRGNPALSEERRASLAGRVGRVCANLGMARVDAEWKEMDKL